jgi:radical SAM superfamily enzyme YgiQ (UPF0313 family)
MSIRKVYLIQPGRDGKMFGRGTMAPYTLMRLASLVPDEIPVRIIDEDLEPVPLDEIGPNDLVGITAKTLQIDRAKWLHSHLKARGATVVVGGVHATLDPDDVQSWADSVAVGEAYRTWPQMIADFDRGQLKPRYVDEEWVNLDDLKPITDRVLKQVDENNRYWTPYMEITRGCPRNCTFCTAVRVSGRVMRLRPVEAVVEEIQRRKLKRFFLTDDNFGLNFRLNPAYMEELFKAMRKLPLHGWTVQAEQLTADYPDLLKLAREAHMDKIFIGFETVNSSNRKEIGGKAKGNLQRYSRSIKQVHDAGLGVVGLFVFGFDADTMEVFSNTYDFIKQSNLDGVSVTILTPFVGTPQRTALLQQNRILKHVPLSLYDTSHVTYIPEQMSPEELAKGYDWITRKLYSWPSIVRRGWSNLSRQPLSAWPRKSVASFSTDLGYRIAYQHRDWVPTTHGQGKIVGGASRDGYMHLLQK